MPLDMSLLPSPDIVEVLDFEDIFAQMLETLKTMDPLFNALVESDPAYKILEVAAYREVVMRARINTAAKASMAAYSTAADLDNLAALVGVTRLLIDAGDTAAVPPVPASFEADADLRTRMQLAWEGFSVAGPVGAYEFHSLSADGDVLDTDIFSPTPGDVTVSVLSRTGDGTASAPLIALVDAKLNSDEIRPLTDNVTVQSATIINYTVTATIKTYDGPDATLVLEAAQTALDAYILSRHKCGHDVTISGLHAALHQAGAQNVTITAPVADLIITNDEASYCTATNISLDGVGE